MLDPSEKAYCRALQALGDKQYQRAAGFFDQAAEFFSDNQEFNLLRETAQLLVEVKKEIAVAEKRDDETLIIEEKFTDGQETILPGQVPEERSGDNLPGV